MTIKKDKMTGSSNQGRPVMITQIQVNQIRALHEQKAGIRKIVRTTGLARNTVRKYISKKPAKKVSFLEANHDEIRRMFFECEGHCVPLRRHIQEKYNQQIHIRTLQRFCEPLRREMKQVDKTIRYETAPGQHMQIDFGERDVCINNEQIRVHFFVAILAFSRRIFVKAYPAENQSAWLDGCESAFMHFKGVPIAIVCDNSKCLVTEHRRCGETRLTRGFKDFCDYWNVNPIASTPYHPQCKGKIERAVRYVKENALPGRKFNSFCELNAWLERWTLTEADNRKLDLFEEGLQTPKERFGQEATALQSINGKPRIALVREETRSVDKNGLIRVDNNYYKLSNGVSNVDVQILIGEQTIVVSRKGLFVEELDKTLGVYQFKQQPAVAPRNPMPELGPVDPRFNRNSLARPVSAYSSAIEAMQQ